MPARLSGVTGFRKAASERSITKIRFVAFETAYESVVSWWISAKAQKFCKKEQIPDANRRNKKLKSGGTDD